MQRKSFFTAFSVLAALAINPLSTSAERFANLFNNSNSAGVANHPTNPTMFTLNAPASISELVTYHWNNGRGARPGTIGLRSQTGQIFGPFAARGVAGQGGVPRFVFKATYADGSTKRAGFAGAQDYVLFQQFMRKLGAKPRSSSPGGASEER